METFWQGAGLSQELACIVPEANHATIGFENQFVRVRACIVHGLFEQ
jgi:hypothetical protein